MAYITQTQIETLIPAPSLIEALDDTRSGQLDETMLAAVIAGADAQVDSYLCGLYDVPFTTVPAVATESSLVFACESIFKRRLAPDEKNPYSERARIWRERLQKIGNGEMPLVHSSGTVNNIGAAVLITSSIDATLRS